MNTNPRITYLSEDDIAFLRDKVLTLLERTGVKMEHAQVPGILAKAGAKVDPDTGIVRFPRGFMEEMLALAPRQLTFHARDAAKDVVVPRADGTFHLRSCTGAYNYLDPETGAHRKVTLADVAAWARLITALDEISFCGSPFPGDVPVETADIHALRAMAANTDKHVWIQPYSLESVPYLIDMATVAAGGEDRMRERSPASIFATALTPFGMKPMDLEVILQAARRGIPLHVCSLPSAGGTAPVTMPGLLVVGAVESLAMVAAVQAVAPGAPVVPLVNVYALDMRTGAGLQSSIEAMRGAAMTAQFIRQGFDLPVHTYGSGSDSPAIDGQSMIERSLLGQLIAFSGADILGGAGQIEVVKTISPIQLVIDNELVAMIRRMIAPIAVDDESVAWDDLLAAAPGSHFLMSDHTLRHCHDGFMPRAFARLSREAWENQGSEDLVARAKSIYRSIMDEASEASTPDMIAELDAIVAAADRRLAA